MYYKIEIQRLFLLQYDSVTLLLFSGCEDVDYNSDNEDHDDEGESEFGGFVVMAATCGTIHHVSRENSQRIFHQTTKRKNGFAVGFYTNTNI